jgi:penicillin-binding protein 2
MTVQCKGHDEPTELYGQKYHCWKEKGHGFMKLRNAIKQSCDTYFYEVARLLGVDRLSITAKKYGLGNELLKGFYFEEKKGIVPNTKWKKNTLGRGWVLGETLITGIGQGYISSTPLQLCLMTAHLANGGFRIKPRIVDDGSISFEDIKAKIENQLYETALIPNLNALEDTEPKFLEPMFRNHENIKFVCDAMYGSTNELYGTSYNSRIEDEKYQFAGKTGTSQVKRITEAEREADLEISEIPYEERDHALYVAFGPYKNPRYSVSILIEHGGTGSSTAAPIAKQIFKKVINRHQEREDIRKKRGQII